MGTILHHLHLQQSGQEQFKHSRGLSQPQPQCAGQKLPHTLTSSHPWYWCCPSGFGQGSLKLSLFSSASWAQCRYWQGLIQPVQKSSSQRSPSATKKSPASLWTLSPATARDTKDCHYYMQKGSQPALRNRTSRDSSSHKWAWQSHSCPALGSTLQTPQKKREQTLPGSEYSLIPPCWEGTAGPTPAFQGSQFKSPLKKTWTKTVL